ncbi:MAG: hypothetical protein PsegKO_02220 [Pseudohongiellaceae bacterium]
MKAQLKAQLKARRDRLPAGESRESLRHSIAGNAEAKQETMTAVYHWFAANGYWT